MNTTIAVRPGDYDNHFPSGYEAGDKQGRRKDYSSAYLRRTYRDGGTVKNETVANLSALPDTSST